MALLEQPAIAVVPGLVELSALAALGEHRELQGQPAVGVEVVRH
jgi:hypothetical protein